MRNLFESSDGEVYEYTEEQIEAGYGANMRRLTEAETAQHLSENSRPDDGVESMQ